MGSDIPEHDPAEHDISTTWKPPGLRDLIAPLQPQEFLDRVWERGVHRTAMSDSHAPGLLLPASGDPYDLIQGIGSRFPYIRLVRDGQDIPAEVFTSTAHQSAPARPDPEKVRHEYDQGATIALLRLHRTESSVRRFGLALEEDLGCLVGVTAYVSPPNPEHSKWRQGLRAHYDTHDVFVLQLEGVKEWTLYDAPYPLPFDDDYQDTTGALPGDPTEQFTLMPNEALYIPRGIFHEAATGQQPSVSLTIGVYVDRWYDALSRAIELLRHDPAFRRGLRSNELRPENASSFRTQLQDVMHAAADEVSAAAVADQLRRLHVLEGLLLR